jgi:D-serine deaminase-like pyridoxal phosphate-dependent protein
MSRDLPLPVLVLRRGALEHNLALMAGWCTAQGVSLAPHGKTTMAPQLFARQLAAGAWGMTAATVHQVRVMRAFGIGRILLANELVDPVGLRWVATELDRDERFDFLCLVDSPEAVARMEAVLTREPPRRPLQVLVELGMPGGRTGVRSDAGALALAAQVAAARHLRLAGFEAYEGLSAPDRAAPTLVPVDALLERLVGVVETADGQALFGTRKEILLTAGGSAYFDRVTAAATRLGRTSRPVRTVLRSGCYLTHDHLAYERTSPFRGSRQAAPGAPVLQPALELWAEVLSAPEPGLAVLGFGKRDAPYDLGLPVPLTLVRADGTHTGIAGLAQVTTLYDQHACLRHALQPAPRPGELVGLGLSHPCGAFDRWQLIPVVDEHYTVVEAIRTFF